MKKGLILICSFFVLQACGMQLIDPNARNNVLPSVPGAGSGETFTVGGEVEGLPLGVKLDLDINDLPYTVDQNGNFTFPYDFDDFTFYEVTTGNLPGGYQCLLTNGEGIIVGADVDDILIQCSCIDPGSQAGDGSPNDPIEIWTPEQLDFVATSTNDADRNYFYKQMCELDYADINPTPIGTLTSPFSGSYDGQGLFIKNYTSGAYTGPISDGHRKGLFGLTDNAILKNINLLNVDIAVHPDIMHDDSLGTGFVGALVGDAFRTVIKDIYAENIQIQANHVAVRAVGGLIGAYRPIISGSESISLEPQQLTRIHVKDIDIDANKIPFVGGMVGEINGVGTHQELFGQNVVIHSCKGCCGGIAGYFEEEDNAPFLPAGMKNVSLIESQITGDGEVGGLLGGINGKLYQSQFQGDVTLTDQYTWTTGSFNFEKTVGGIVGRDYGTSSNISNVVAVSNVYSDSPADPSGAFYGINDNLTLTNNTYLDGQICQNCLPNNEISAQLDINLLFAGTDQAQTNAPHAWDFESHWCVISQALPSLQNVAFSLCE